jgi:hypothetical protein
VRNPLAACRGRVSLFVKPEEQGPRRDKRTLQRAIETSAVEEKALELDDRAVNVDDRASKRDDGVVDVGESRWAT